MFNKGLALQRPTREAGYLALPMLMQLAGMNVPKEWIQSIYKEMFTPDQLQQMGVLKKSNAATSQGLPSIDGLRKEYEAYKQANMVGVPTLVPGSESSLAGPYYDYNNQTPSFRGLPFDQWTDNRLASIPQQKQGLGEFDISSLATYSPQVSPLFKLQQEQGESAINRSLAARGLFNSGAAIRSLSDFNRNLLAEESQRQYGRLADIVNLGSGAAAGGAASAQNTGNTLASAYQNLGQGLQQAAYQGGQARAGMYQNMSNQIMGGFGAYMQNNQFNQMMDLYKTKGLNSYNTFWGAP